MSFCFKRLCLSSLLLPYFACGESAAVRSLNFRETYQDILDHSLELKAAAADVYAKDGIIIQAGALPNPELTVNLDKIGRSVEGDENELFVGITQLVELGGKRSARRRVADAVYCSALWNLEKMKYDLFGRVLHAFIDLAIAQERLALAQAQHGVSDETFNCASIKASSGKTSAIEMKKAEISCKSAKLAVSRRQAQLAQAKKQLQILWDCQAPPFDTVCFPIYETTPPPPLDLLSESLSLNPEMVEAHAQLLRASEVVSLERSLRVPDIAFQVGVTTERFYKEPTLSVGFDIPLPLFNRNQGNISRATYERTQAAYTEMNIQCHLAALLNALYEQWYAAYEQAMEIKTSLLPPAEEAYELAQLSYQEGKFDYLYLLDARSTLFGIQEQYLNAVEEYHHKRAEILKLTAQCSDLE